jgi:hypothetical protein
VVGVAVFSLRLDPWNLIWVIPAKGTCGKDPHHIFHQAVSRWERLFFFKPIRFYSGCQKNVPVFKRFFYNRTTVQPFMPSFRIS